jgi:chorismate dehydratase
VSRPVRLGAVSYLNVRPLVHGLDRHPADVSLRFDVPAICADLLARGEIDLGMVPSIAYLDRPGDRAVPGVCIGSDGPVASVALFSRVPVAAIHRVALDSSSRTSAALTRILCRQRFGISPAFVPHAPDLQTMLAGADAALLIGDPALFADVPAGVEKIDLGATWTDMTGLPFVWAFWAGPAGSASGDVVRLLQSSAETGMAQSDEIADAYCAPRADRQQLARRYLRENLRFHFDDRALAGLRLYFREAAALGLAPSAGPVEFFEAATRIE